MGRRAQEQKLPDRAAVYPRKTESHRGMVIAARMAAWAFTCLSQPFTWLSFGPSLGEFPGRFAVLAQSRPSLSASGSPYAYLPYWLIVWPRSRGAHWPRLSWDCRRVIHGSWLNTRIAAKLPCQIVGNDGVSDDPKKRSRAWIGWTLIAVFVLYPRSIGPAAGMECYSPLRGEKLNRFVSVTYAPLERLYKANRILEKAVDRYVWLWVMDIGTLPRAPAPQGVVLYPNSPPK
jgi:hypothetical protein